MLNVSKRLQQVPASPIRKLVPLADAAKGRGVEVIHLNIGDPDIPTPSVMIDRLKAWEGGIPYAHSQGDAELLEALTEYYHQAGYDWVTKADIQVTVGGSEALSMTMTAVADPGEEILLFEPFFPSYASLAMASGIKAVPVTTKIETGFHLPVEIEKEIETKVNTKTKAILMTNPNNPTGTVYTRAEVERLIEIARKHDLWLLADEVYREFVFSDQASVSLLSYMDREPQRLVVLDSLSKRYSAPGLRLGTIVSKNRELMGGALRMAMARLSAGFIDQKAAAQLAKISQAELLEVRDEYQRRRDVIFEGLSAVEGVTITQPGGAFYCVAGLPVEDAEKFCAWLLTDFNLDGKTVMLAPMAGFYLSSGLGRQEVRIAYVVGEAKLKQAVEVLKRALAVYPDLK